MSDANLYENMNLTDIRHKDGHRIPIRVNIFPIYNGDEIVGVFMISNEYEGTIIAEKNTCSN